MTERPEEAQALAQIEADVSTSFTKGFRDDL
jgi:hypothetical protein